MAAGNFQVIKAIQPTTWGGSPEYRTLYLTARISDKLFDKLGGTSDVEADFYTFTFIVDPTNSFRIYCPREGVYGDDDYGAYLEYEPVNSYLREYSAEISEIIGYSGYGFEEIPDFDITDEM